MKNEEMKKKKKKMKKKNISALDYIDLLGKIYRSPSLSRMPFPLRRGPRCQVAPPRWHG
jgi:hypothetical protein